MRACVYDGVNIKRLSILFLIAEGGGTERGDGGMVVVVVEGREGVGGSERHRKIKGLTKHSDTLIHSHVNFFLFSIQFLSM